MKVLTRQTLVRMVNRVATASVSQSWAGGGDPDDIPNIKLEVVLASNRANEVIDMVFAERAELVAALIAAIECTAPDDKLRAVAAKYKVKS